MSDEDDPNDDPARRLGETSAALAEWTARAAGDSEALIQRLVGMGYEVEGKSEDEIAEILRKPPTRPSAKPH